MEPDFKEDKFDFGVHILKRRNFFNDRPVKEWVFTEYYSYYVDLLGDTLLKTVISNYKNDIQWLKSMKQLSHPVQIYLGTMFYEINNASLRDIQNSIDNKKDAQMPGVAFNAPIYTVTTIGSNDTKVTFKNNEFSNAPNNMKRHHDGQMDPTNKKQKTTTDENAHPENDDDDKDDQDDEHSDGSVSSINSTMEQEVEWTFWDSCRDILMSAEMDLEINQFSPHKHGVIVCGDKLHQTEENAIDAAVYTLVVNHMNSGNDFSMDRSVTFAEVEEYFTTVFGAEKSNMVDCARYPVPATDPKKRNFIADMTLSMYVCFRDIYDSESNLKHSESMLNSACLYPAIRFACQAVTKGKLLFYPGEERLNAMNMVLGDDTVIYRGDAIVRMRGALKLEVLLLETSNAHGGCTESKKAFDFYKALWRLRSPNDNKNHHHHHHPNHHSNQQQQEQKAQKRNSDIIIIDNDHTPPLPPTTEPVAGNDSYSSTKNNENLIHADTNNNETVNNYNNENLLFQCIQTALLTTPPLPVPPPSRRRGSRQPRPQSTIIKNTTSTLDPVPTKRWSTVVEQQQQWIENHHHNYQ
ncbi:hypothetical protein BDC45DRAFT_93862 [Circinella umbellata]|nr:hypothetical protein BDC45DRAFT_93862 [Circinella umbellata]